MKHLYLIGGTMGIGKTTICQRLKHELNQSVFLDGDWCWDMNPFIVDNETKEMVIENIVFLLNNFIQCSHYQHIIFCWVMHEQRIIDTLTDKLTTSGCYIHPISLVSDEAALVKKLEHDIAQGKRSSSIIPQSIARLVNYQHLQTIKIDVTHLTPLEAAHLIKEGASNE